MTFITWLGGKKRLLVHINHTIAKYLADETSNDTIYVEPFLGSGVVLINILEKYPTRFRRYICCDANGALINTFNQIKVNHQNLITMLERLQRHFIALDMNDRKVFYYKARDLFNDIRLRRPLDISNLDGLELSEDHDLLLSSLFVFLNKTCFRGLFRVNAKNELVSSFGYFSPQPKIVKPALINKLHQLFSTNNVSFVCSSYDKLDLNDNDKVFLYLDPPYYNTFDKYTWDGFDQDAFIKYLEVLTNKDNYKVILSNSKDFQDIISKNQKINLPTVKTVSVRDFTNTTTPAKDRVEILASNL